MQNLVILIGRLGQDPESRALSSGSPVCNFSMVTTEKWRDKNSGEKKEAAEWHNVCAFGQLASICQEHLGKGSLVSVIGKLKTDKYEKDGITRYSTKIIARELKMLGGGLPKDQSTAGFSQPKSNESQQFPGDAKKQLDDDIPF